MIKEVLRSRSSKCAFFFIVTMILVSYFAPLIANNKPIFCVFEGKTRFSAFRDLFPFNRFLKPDDISLKLQANPYFIEDAKKDGRIRKCILSPCPYSPFETNIDDISTPPDFKKKHFFGCDDNGRDIFARLVYGSKNSLLIGFVAVFIAGFLGIIIGGIGGFFGGVVDQIFISRLIEVMLSFPTFFLVITIAAVMEAKYLNVWTLMIIIGLTSWTGIARYTRGEFMKLKKAEFVSAAEVMGASARFIIFRHLVPNSVAPIIVALTFGVGSAILAESGLSFLGVGVQPPEPSWGNVLSLIQKSWNSWWIGVFPGIMIFLSVLSYNLLGDALRDVLDPKELRK